MYENLRKLAEVLTPSAYVDKYSKLPELKSHLPVRHNDIQNVSSQLADDVSKSRFSLMGSLQNDTHQGRTDQSGIRESLIRAMQQQSADPHVNRRLTQYRGSPVAQQLFQARHPNSAAIRYLQVPEEIRKHELFGRLLHRGSAFATTGGDVYVPHHLRHIEDNDREFFKHMGYEGVQNHEFEHLNKQFLDVSPADLELINTYRNAVGGTHITGSPDSTEGIAARKLQKRLAAAVSKFRNQQYISEDTAEFGPNVGDLLFMGERFAREHGYDPSARTQLPEAEAQKLRGNYPALMEMAEQKPDSRLLQHTVAFPGGKKHDINWMRDQAHQHGYFKGRGIDPLIFDTPEGRQWYFDMLRRYRGKK